VGSRAGLDVVKKPEHPWPCREPNPGRPVRIYINTFYQAAVSV